MFETDCETGVVGMQHAQDRAMTHAPLCRKDNQRKKTSRHGYSLQANRQSDLVSRVMSARASGNVALERQLSAELLVSVRPFIRRVLFTLRPGTASMAEDLEQVAAEAVLRAIAVYDPTRGSQSFGEVAYFRARAACDHYARLHTTDVHLSDGEHKGRTMRAAPITGRKSVHVHFVDVSSQSTDVDGQQAPWIDELESAIREMSCRESKSDTPEAGLLVAERRALVFEAVQRLAPRKRELVLRVFGLNCPAQSARAVAESWGTSKSSVDRMLARALDELRELLADECE